MAVRIGRWLGPAVGAAMVSGVALIWWLHWFDFVDLEVYRAGAAALLHGHDIYQARPAASPLPFTYPPFAAIVFMPLAVLPDTLARIAVSLLSIWALATAAWVSLRFVAPRWPGRPRVTVTLAVCALAPLMEPVRDTLRFGQINLVLMALVLTDLSSTAGGRRSRWHGVLIGVATAVKLTPAIFILYLLVTRRTRQAVTALAAAAGATLCAFAVMPGASARYWTHLVFDDRRIGSAGFVWNQSLRGAVARVAGSAGGGRLLWVVTAGALLILGMALAARAQRSGDELLGAGLAALCGLLVSPISWDHHWVWALPVAIALARRWTGVAAGWVTVFLLAPMSWWAFAGADDYHLGLGQGLAADCYVLAALALMIFVGSQLRSGTPHSHIPNPTLLSNR